MTTAIIAVAFFAVAVILFLFAVAIARAARDIEPVREDTGEYDPEK